MAASLVHSNKNMKRTESKKSPSWWWDSHISRKNSKWLAENLEEMDQSVKRMLKLVEEDGDSFAKKAEMYYQKRPELISHVEDFYRMYRSLAERYDHVTGELRKNIPSDLQSQGSGISDMGSELPSTCPSPDQRLTRRKSGPRAAGFEFFLGSGGSNSDTYQKEGDESSTLTDSDSESDVSSVNNYSGSLGIGGDQMINGKIIELEIELREVKERLRMQQEENADGSLRASRSEHFEDLFVRIAGYEQELRNANEKIRLSEEEIARLKIELHRYKSSKFTNDLEAEFESSTEKDVNSQEAVLEPEVNQASELHERTGGLESETLNPDSKIRALVEELRITKERLQDSEKEMTNLKNEFESNRSSERISHLQDQLESAQKEIAMWKAKLNSEKREVSKLQERISRLKTSLSDRDHEIRELKIAVSDAEQKIFPEKAQIKVEISGLLEERMRFEEQLREWESRGRALEEEIRKVKAEKTKMEGRLNVEIKQLRTDIAERSECIESLSGSVDALKAEKDELNARVLTIKAEVSCRDDRIEEMDKHLHQLHVKHAELIADADGARKLVEELRSRSNELEKEIERQRVLVLEGAEEKREVIRQLCFSLEHYRNGYHRLRQAYKGHKRVPVFAS